MKNEISDANIIIVGLEDNAIIRKQYTIIINSELKNLSKLQNVEYIEASEVKKIIIQYR